ncbi:hypothetical protein ABZU75_23460 [Streptosporangium sp. NPDC005286]|uniref:hypothetical protein n=1 Tax=Streptosporangium sp. NPDC005286 TaxID=3154463 RepID=UPI0033B1D4D0
MHLKLSSTGQLGGEENHLVSSGCLAEFLAGGDYPLEHPDPNGTSGQPYTSTQLAKIQRERDARAALLTLREER